MKSSGPFTALIALGLCAPVFVHAAESPSAHQHGDGAPSGAVSGLKKEMTAGLTESDFLTLGDKEKSVKLVIVATWSDDNYGMNFNGWSKGGAVYTIPKGWSVEVTFINPGPVPHSLIVIEKADVRKIQMAEPYFEGGAVPKHLQGMSYAKATFSFNTTESGEYAFACGFPTHAMNGHWIGLEISDDAKVPTLKLGEKPAMKASK